jgi:hypothetical protein
LLRILMGVAVVKRSALRLCGSKRLDGRGLICISDRGPLPPHTLEGKLTQVLGHHVVLALSLTKLHQRDIVLCGEPFQR